MAPGPRMVQQNKVYNAVLAAEPSQQQGPQCRPCSSAVPPALQLHCTSELGLMNSSLSRYKDGATTLLLHCKDAQMQRNKDGEKVYFSLQGRHKSQSPSLQARHQCSSPAVHAWRHSSCTAGRAQTLHSFMLCTDGAAVLCTWCLMSPRIA